MREHKKSGEVVSIGFYRQASAEARHNLAGMTHTAFRATTSGIPDMPHIGSIYGPEDQPYLRSRLTLSGNDIIRATGRESFGGIVHFPRRKKP